MDARLVIFILLVIGIGGAALYHFIKTCRESEKVMDEIEFEVHTIEDEIHRCKVYWDSQVRVEPVSIKDTGSCDYE